MADETRREALAFLTDAQRQYLRLVRAGRTSKEIAQAVGGSHHTVNAEIAKACRLLGAPSRSKAAEILAAHEAAGGSYEPSYEPAALVDAGARQPEAIPEAGVAVLPQRPPETIPRGVVSGADQGANGPALLPFATARKPFNELSVSLRLFWILAIAVVTAIFAVGLIGSVDNSLRGLASLL